MNRARQELEEHTSNIINDAKKDIQNSLQSWISGHLSNSMDSKKEYIIKQLDHLINNKYDDGDLLGPELHGIIVRAMSDFIAQALKGATTNFNVSVKIPSGYYYEED